MTKSAKTTDSSLFKPAYLFGIALIFAAIGVFMLRSNNLRMSEVRERVYLADEENGNISESLDELRLFVYTHMNASTTVELKYSYERDTTKALKKAETKRGKGNNIFDDLPADCNPGGTFVDRTEPCVQEHIDRRIKELGSNNSQVLRLPDKRLYVYDFKSPLLSFDFAGWMLIFASASAIFGCCWILIRFIRNEIAFYKGDIEGL